MLDEVLRLIPDDNPNAEEYREAYKKWTAENPDKAEDVLARVIKKIEPNGDYTFSYGFTGDPPTDAKVDYFDYAT